MPMASQAREWGKLQVFYLVVFGVFLFVVMFWAALGQAPLSGTRIESVLEILLVVLINLGIGALGGGAIIEIWRGNWSRFERLEHVFMIFALPALVLSDAGLAWWVFSSDAGAFYRWAFLIVALAGIAAGAGLDWLPLGLPGRPKRALWPHHRPQAPGDEKWGPLTPLSILLGCALGVTVAVAYLGISAWQENLDVLVGHPLPTALTGIHGDYVALGDSYSAGNGLTPYAADTIADGCNRSVSSAYPDLLYALLRQQDPGASFTFTACSGALTGDIFDTTVFPTFNIPPQVSGAVEPSVGLVTITIGGDDADFANVVEQCLISGDCLNEEFPPQGVPEMTSVQIPQGKLLAQWGPETIEAIGKSDAKLFKNLRADFPQARILVIGYPYLFPDQAAPSFPYYPPLCASILNRLSVTERVGIRTLQDEFNDRIYEEAVAAGIEFISPVAIWNQHEPCGSSGQYTNSVKPYLHFPNPINGSSFHPNTAGQQTLAALVACYLDANHAPPDPFASAGSHTVTIPASQLVAPAQLGLVPSPGLDSVPGSGVINGC
jgi:hypothetical protein